MPGEKDYLSKDWEGGPAVSCTTVGEGCRQDWCDIYLPFP